MQIFFDEKLILNVLSEIENNSDHSKYWNISRQLGEKLSGIILENKPQNILEIGTSNGFSTIWIAKSLSRDAKITTVDVDESRLSEAQENFSKSGIEENIICFNEEIIELLESEKLDHQFDFIFLDAAQKKYSQIVDLLIQKNLLTENHIIVADNVLSHKYMGEFVEKMKQIYNCEIYEKDSGLLIARSF